MSKARTRRKAEKPKPSAGGATRSSLHRIDMGGLPPALGDWRSAATATELIRRYGRWVHRCITINMETNLR